MADRKLLGLGFCSVCPVPRFCQFPHLYNGISAMNVASNSSFFRNYSGRTSLRDERSLALVSSGIFLRSEDYTSTS